MANIIYEYTTENGEKILIAATTSDMRGGENTTIKKVQIKFEEALGTVKAAATALKNVMDEVKPNEVEIEFSVKAEGEAGFFAICKATTGAEFKITLKWKKENTKTDG